MKKHRGLFLALGLAALVSLSAREGRAETITMTLTWTGHTLTIDYLSPFAQAGSTATNLTVDTGTLNSFLSSNGSAYNFTDLGSKSLDYPGTAAGATLSQNGDASIVGPGDTSINIHSNLDGYQLPTGQGTIFSTSTADFLQSTAGDNQFSSTSLNGSVVDSHTFVSNGAPTFAPPAYNAQTGVGTVNAGFSLDNTTTLNMTTGSDQFAVQTVLHATAVPEPASVVMLLTGMPLPLVVMGLLRRRRAAA